MAVSLTEDCIARMLEDSERNVDFQPLVQVLTVKMIKATKEGASDRYRLILSDGTHFAQCECCQIYCITHIKPAHHLISITAMLATQLKGLVEQEGLGRNFIIKIKSYATNTIQDRKLIILLDVEILDANVADRIGDPRNYDPRPLAGGAAPAVKTEGGAAGMSSAARPQQNAGSMGNVRRTPAPGVRAGGVDAALRQNPVYPIEGLSPYQNKWTIKARVTSKSEIKYWSNARGDGKLFSVNLLDETGEIKATGFNDAVDKLHPLFVENKVYYISRAKVNIAKKQFSTVNNEYEITFEKDSEVVECKEDDASDVPEVKYNFVPLDQLDSVEPKQTCDVVGIVDSVGELGEIISKASQKPVQKRELVFVDQTGMSVRLTLWGKTAMTYGTDKGHVGAGIDDRPVVAFKNISVGDFGGRSLSMTSSSSMMVNPDLPEAHSLRGWYDDEGVALSSKQAFKSYSSAMLGNSTVGANANDSKERKTIGEVKDLGLGTKPEGKADYFNMRATLVYIRNENLYYTACPGEKAPGEKCQKKVVCESEGNWRCERCNRSYETPDYRYMLSANVQDYTGQLWISSFNDVGEQIVGMKAEELEQLRNQDDGEAKYQQVLTRAANKMYMFNCRAKMDTFQDQERVRYSVTRLSEVDYAKAANELVESMKKFL